MTGITVAVADERVDVARLRHHLDAELVERVASVDPADVARTDDRTVLVTTDEAVPSSETALAVGVREPFDDGSADENGAYRALARRVNAAAAELVGDDDAALETDSADAVPETDGTDAEPDAADTELPAGDGGAGDRDEFRYRAPLDDPLSVSPTTGERGPFLGIALANGIDWADRIHHSDREDAGWAAADAAGNGDRFAVTYRVETADGGRRWVRQHGEPVDDHVEGRVRALPPAGGHGELVPDVDRLVETLFDDLPLFLFVKDEHKQLVRASRTPYDFHGPDANRVHSPGAHANETRKLLNAEERVLETGEPMINREFEFPHPLSPGDDDVSVTEVPLRDEAGNTRGLVGVIHNIGPQKRAERRAERSRTLLARVARNVSEELMDAIAVTSATLDAARETGNVDRLGRADDALESASDAVGDLLALASVSESDADPDPVRLDELARDAWNRLEAPDGRFRIETPDVELRANHERFVVLLELLYRAAFEAGTDEVTVLAIEEGPGSVAIELDDATLPSEGSFTREIAADVAAVSGWTVEFAANGRRIEIGGPDLYTSSSRFEDPRWHAVADASVVGTSNPGGFERRGTDELVRLTGAGKNVWLYTNECNYLAAPLAGDFDLSMRVVEFDPELQYDATPDESAKVGLMVRDRLDEDAAHAFVGARIDRDTEMLWSEHPATMTVDERGPDIGAPCWLRLVREDAAVTGYVSADGTDWHRIAEREIELPTEPYVGVAICSAKGGEPVLATVEPPASLSGLERYDVGDVQVTGTVSRISDFTYELESVGAGPADDGDELNVATTTLGGDVECIGRVDAPAGSTPALTIRDALDPAAAHVTITASDGDGASCIWRSGPEADTISYERQSIASAWLKLVRRDSQITGYASSDGEEWTEIGQVGSFLSDDVHVGFAAWGDGGTATFESARVYDR